MKFQRRKGVSVIIATLLLIAIAVAASILVYVFVNGLAGSLTQGGGQQTTERLQMQSSNFVISPGTCGCSLKILELYLLNSGSASTTISTVYYDGALVAIAGTDPATVATPASFAAANVFSTSDSAHVLNSGSATSFYYSAGATQALTYSVGGTGILTIGLTAAATAGTSHTVKVVSTTGATYVFSVTAGRAG